MKKGLCMAGMLWLLFVAVFPVCAAQNKVVTAFGLDGKIYVFLEADEEAEIQLSFEGMPLQGERQMSQPLVDSGQKVHYFLLLDRSTSMERHRGQVLEFITELLANTQVKKTVSLLSFGDAFGVEIEAAVDEDAVLKKLQEIPSDEQKTNLYKGICSAFDYVEGQDRSGGDLYQIVLITDGALYEASDEPTPIQTKERVTKAKDIVFATLGLGDETNFQDFPIEDSLWKSATNHDVSLAAAEIAEKVNQLYTVCFDLEQQYADSALDIVLFFPESKETCRVNDVPVVGGKDKEQDGESIVQNLPERKEKLGEEEEEQEKEKLEKEEPKEGNFEEEKKEEPVGKSEEEQQSEGEPEKRAGTEQCGLAQEAGGSGSWKEAFDKNSWLKQFLVYGSFLLCGIILGSGLMLLMKKKQYKKKEMLEENSKIDRQQGPRLQVEALSGHCLTRQRNFSMDSDVVIGRNKKCDMVWKDEDVTDQNTRIFMRNGMVYIEDLDSLYGTAVNGMRIYAPNPLRDGDVISIGRVQFRILL